MGISFELGLLLENQIDVIYPLFTGIFVGLPDLYDVPNG